jgi:hypothetical protein
MASVLSSQQNRVLPSVLGTIFVLLVLTVQFCPAQKPDAASKHPATVASAKSAAASPKLTPQQERGLRLLKAAEAGIAGLQPDMRAFALWRASYAYIQVDAKKAEQLTEDSFIASQSISDSSNEQCGPIGSAGDIKSWIQERILTEFIRKEKIATAERLLPTAAEAVRSRITAELVKHYVTKKDFSRAQGLLTEVADVDEYPFGAAGDLFLALGPERSADQITIFDQALNNFEQHGSKNGFGTDDLASLIERTWTKLPPTLVIEAVDKMLDEAKSKESHASFSMSTDKGSVNLSSAYQQRLFQLLPILQELDKDKADALLRDNAETRAQLAKYPKGMGSLSSDGNVSSFGITDDDTPQASTGAAKQQIEQQVMKRMNEVIGEADKDPAQAVSDALILPLQGGFASSSPRASALLNIAGKIQRKKPALAKSALDEILKIEDQLDPQQIQSIDDLPLKYLELGDVDDAQKSLKPMLKAAEKLYAHDTDADDPNKAFKGSWPSTDLWRKCVQTAGRISDALAEETLADIPDPEIAALERISYAGTLLGAGAIPVIVGDCRQQGSSYNFSN